eukprot:scaffold8658_cov101-Cylindrotheca_fusiformis.AAC.5
MAFSLLVALYMFVKSRSVPPSQMVHMQDDQPTRVKSIAYHATEPWMILSFYSGHVVIWKHEKSYRYSVSPGYVARACQFLNKDDLWVAASDDKQIRVLDHHGKIVKKFQAHDDFIRSLEVHRSRPYLLSASDDMTLKLWDTEYNYECIRTYQGHMHYVMQVKMNPTDSNQFATCSLDRSIKFWSLEETEPLFSLEGHERGVNTIDFLQDGSEKTLLASGSDDRTVKVWNYQTRQLLHSFSGHTENVTAVLYSLHNDVIVSTSEDCSVRVWNLGNADDNDDRVRRSQELLTLQYKALGRGWSMAGSKCNAKDQIAVGFDQGCLLIDLARDPQTGTLEVTKEQNITNRTLDNEHSPILELQSTVEDDTLLASSNRVSLHVWFFNSFDASSSCLTVQPQHDTPSNPQSSARSDRSKKSTVLLQSRVHMFPLPTYTFLQNTFCGNG